MNPKHFRIGFVLGVMVFVLHQLAKLTIIVGFGYVLGHFIIKFW